MIKNENRSDKNELSDVRFTWLVSDDVQFSNDRIVFFKLSHATKWNKKY
jgi:hypothetical protein